MYGALKDTLAKELQEIQDAGLFKEERVILSPQAGKLPLRITSS